MTTRCPDAVAVAYEPLWHLLYRYWFWGWLFADVNTGDLVRRAAAWRHNVRQRVHLPVYMRRWCALLIATGSVAVAVETALHAPTLAAAFYVWAVLSLMVEVIAAIAWVFLRER
jgi:hypothetical protein